jgi:tetratricopeptide (TPR) repeat protein
VSEIDQNGAAEGLFKEIAALLEQGEDDKALERAEGALADPLLHGVAPAAMAAIYYRAGALGYTIKLLVSHLEQPNHFPETADLLAVLYALAGNLSDALYYAKLSTTQEKGAGNLAALFGPRFPAFADAFAAIRSKPLLAQARGELAAAQYERALFTVQQHLSILPEDVEALDLYALALIRLGRITEGIGMLRSVATLAGPSATLLSRLGHSLIQVGEVYDGIACHVEASARTGINSPLLGAAVADLAYLDKGQAQATGLADAWSRQIAAQAPKTVRPAPKYQGALPLRLCYLCGSAEDEDTKAMLGAIARGHDRSRAFVLGFGKGDIEGDAAAWARGAFDLWRDVSSLDVTTMGALIRGEGVHAAIDADGLRLPGQAGLFQRNSAPLQLAWLNQPVVGRAPGNFRSLVPAGQPAGETELVLPFGRYCLGAADGAAPVAKDAPVLSSTTVTFGAELTRAELNPAIAMVWGRILNAVPGSMLLLRDTGLLAEPGAIERVVALFGNSGVAHRIDVVRAISRDDFADGIDIALMPAPAANITAYAAFQRRGVPVVVMSDCDPGADFAAFLAAAGLSDSLVGRDLADYALKAVSLAADHGQLAGLRARMPGLISQVPGFTPAGFARALEDAILSVLQTL